VKVTDSWKLPDALHSHGLGPGHRQDLPNPGTHWKIHPPAGDEGYRGTAVAFVENTLALKLHISKKIKDTFAVLPICWIVERTFAWLGNYRRLSRDHGKLTLTAENMVRVAMLRVMLTRLG
jgi:putative transposase